MDKSSPTECVCNISWMARRICSARGILQAKSNPCLGIISSLSKRQLLAMTSVQILWYRWHISSIFIKTTCKIEIWTVIYILSAKKKTPKTLWQLSWIPAMGSTYINIYIHTHTSNIFSYDFLLMWQHDQCSEEAEPSENTTCRTGHV